MDIKDIIDALVTSGKPQVEIAEYLNATCNGDSEEARSYLHERFNSSPQKALSESIREWIELQEGWFDTKQMDMDLGIFTPAQKNMRRVELFRLKQDGLVEPNKGQSGKYRSVHAEADEIDWWNADPTQRIDLKWAFPIHDLCYLAPGNIVVVAGSSNAGKTALLLDMVQRNMDNYPIKYQSSEMGREELGGRIKLFDKRGICPEDEWHKARFVERSSDFVDCVDKDVINVIDYLELTDNFYQVGGMILDIWKKLDGTGLGVIAIQKEPKADLGRGGQFSMEKARLYLTMDNNMLTIKKAKNRTDPSKNPNGMAWTFLDIWGGCQFKDVMEWKG